MFFDQYCDIMRTHGIGELSFNYDDKKYSILIKTGDLDIYYLFLEKNCDAKVFYDFEELISLKTLFNGKNLQEIWSQIEIIAIDGVSEAEYNVEECSFDFQKWKRERGTLQWRYMASGKESFIYQIKYILLGIIILPLLSIIFPLLKLTNWNFVLLIGACAIFALIVSLVVILKNRIIINYIVTDKRIIAFKGIQYETTYENIKKIKLKKHLFKSGCGSIKIYVKKGVSINYHIENIPEADKVYRIIIENINTLS